MIAAALGADVYRGHAKEVGFHAIEVLDAEAAAPSGRCAGAALARRYLHPAAARRNCWRRAMSIRIRPSAAGAMCWRCNSTPKWAKTRASTPGSSSRPKTSRQRATPESLRAIHDRHGAGAVTAGRAMIGEWLSTLQ
jgi:GMP synthase (glutamine-hydrolysing)